MSTTTRVWRSISLSLTRALPFRFAIILVIAMALMRERCLP